MKKGMIRNKEIIHTLSPNIKFIYIGILKTRSKVSLWQAFLSCFDASTNKYYISRKWTYSGIIVKNCEEPKR